MKSQGQEIASLLPILLTHDFCLRAGTMLSIVAKRLLPAKLKGTCGIGD